MLWSVCSHYRIFVAGLTVPFPAHMCAHKRGVLHRDISSRNVLIVQDSEGHSRGLLIDWDLSYDEKRHSAKEQHCITVHLVVLHH